MTYYDVVLLLLIFTNTATMVGWYFCADSRDRDRAYLRRLTQDAIREHRELERKYQQTLRDLYGAGK